MNPGFQGLSQDSISKREKLVNQRENGGSEREGDGIYENRRTLKHGPGVASTQQPLNSKLETGPV